VSKEIDEVFRREGETRKERERWVKEFEKQRGGDSGLKMMIDFFTICVN